MVMIICTTLVVADYLTRVVDTNGDGAAEAVWRGDQIHLVAPAQDRGAAVGANAHNCIGIIYGESSAVSVADLRRRAASGPPVRSKANEIGRPEVGKKYLRVAHNRAAPVDAIGGAVDCSVVGPKVERPGPQSRM